MEFCKEVSAEGKTEVRTWLPREVVSFSIYLFILEAFRYYSLHSMRVRLLCLSHS